MQHIHLNDMIGYISSFDICFQISSEMEHFVFCFKKYVSF